MIIPINVASSSSNPKLPPNLAKISHDEIVLVELQGAFEVECNHPSERDGKLIGKFNFDPATVSFQLLAEASSVFSTALHSYSYLILFWYPKRYDGNLSQNKSTLLIGHHLLEGKLTSLAKPLAVLLRSKAPSCTMTISGTGAMQPDEDDEDVEMMLNHDQETQLDNVDTRTSANTVEWDVVALIKRKIVFAKRPMPIVNLNARMGT